MRILCRNNPLFLFLIRYSLLSLILQSSDSDLSPAISFPLWISIQKIAAHVDRNEAAAFHRQPVLIFQNPLTMTRLHAIMTTLKQSVCFIDFYIYVLPESSIQLQKPVSKSFQEYV